MSKASEAKAAQGYVPKAKQKVCGNCGHYRSVTRYGEEKEKRCSLGGFAVAKLGVCMRHEFKSDTNEQ